MTETVTPLSETVSQIAVVGISTSQKSHRMMQQDMLRELR